MKRHSQANLPRIKLRVSASLQKDHNIHSEADLKNSPSAHSHDQNFQTDSSNMNPETNTPALESANVIKRQKTLDEIDAVLAEITSERQKIFESEKKDAIALVKKLVDKYSISSADLGNSDTVSDRKPSVKVAPVVRYKKGDNTWSGRGPRPLWVKEIINAGGDIKDYRVE